MYKVGICGHFGQGKKYLDGQTIKTKILTKELREAVGSNLVMTLDTNNWRRNPISFLFKCLLLMIKCENIVILPAHNGIRVFGQLFVNLKKLYKRQLHYVVIGGWLPELLEKNSKLKEILKKFDGIYVETNIMIEELNKLGMDNVKYLTNFKHLNILEASDLVYQIKEPYKLCTFSRVMEEKGIEDAISVVNEINEFCGRIVFQLDIYGQIDERYRQKFENLEGDFPNYISYKGIVDFKNTTAVLKDYFLLLFPTHFRTEGVPGTIIDAYSAGVPVIASNWNSASELIYHGTTGYIYDFCDNNKLKDLLVQILDNPDKVNQLKKNCLIKAKQHSPDLAIQNFLNIYN